MDPLARTLDWKSVDKRGLVAGIVAALAFGPYSLLCLSIGGEGGATGYVLLLASALLAGFLIGSPWAVLASVPFVIGGLVWLNNPSPFENSDGSYGGFVLIFVALPVALAAGVGAFVRARTRR
jgi:hypothetical protein